MKDLNVTLIQTDLVWEDVDANLARLSSRLDQVPPHSDLVILPEMFSTGFSMEAPRLAEPMDGRAVRWLGDQAGRRGVPITGSLMIEEKGLFYNRLIWMQPDGRFSTYDKKHLFAYAGEDKIYTAGSRPLTISMKGWRVRPFICYDLRFPVWCRNLDKAYDLALFVANWPHGRAVHWQILLRARAIENQAYTVGVNRVGTDGKGNEHSGDSAVIDPMGEVLFERSGEECVETVRLKRGALEEYRAAFPAWKDGGQGGKTEGRPLTLGRSLRSDEGR